MNLVLALQKTYSRTKNSRTMREKAWKQEIKDL
jgi:hypothetical protein